MATHTYLECECSADEHMIRLTYFPKTVNSDGTEELSELYINYFLAAPGFFQRLKNGIKYIFGYKCRYGHFGSTCFGPETARKFKNVLDEYLSDK